MFSQAFSFALIRKVMYESKFIPEFLLNEACIFIFRTGYLAIIGNNLAAAINKRLWSDALGSSMPIRIKSNPFFRLSIHTDTPLHIAKQQHYY